MAVEFSFMCFFLWNNHQVPGDMMFLFFLTLTTRFFGVMISVWMCFFGGVKFVLNVGAEALIAKMFGDMFGDTPFSTGSLNLT